MAQDEYRLPIFVGPAEEAAIAALQEHMGARTSKNGAVRYALLAWHRRHKHEASDRAAAEASKRAIQGKIAEGIERPDPQRESV